MLLFCYRKTYPLFVTSRKNKVINSKNYHKLRTAGRKGASKQAVTSGEVIAQGRSRFRASWNCRSVVVAQCSSASPWIRLAVTFHQIPCTKSKVFQLSGLIFIRLNCPHANNHASTESTSGGVCFPLVTAVRALSDYNPHSNILVWCPR